MDEAIRLMHLRAGEAYGRERTCGKKIDHGSEATADKSAEALNRRPKRLHDVEAYPCFFCSGWHVSREMTDEERAQFS